MELHRVDLNLLVSFDVLMSERSVTRAAHRLSIGQSAMSSTLSRLRRLFDDPLLVRDGRRLVATPFAESMEQPVRDALAQMSELLSRGNSFDPKSDDRSFTVVASDYVVLTFLHPMLARLRGEAPNVRLRLRPAAGEFEAVLRRNEADAVVLPREVFSNYRDYRHELLFSDDWVCAVAADNPQVGDTFSMEQFLGLPYLATASGTLPSSVELQLDERGIERRTEVTAGIGIAPFLLEGTSMFTVIPRRLAAKVSKIAPIKVLEAPLDLTPLSEVIVWTPRNDNDQGHQWLRRQLIDLASDDLAFPPH